jgi:hypothetical protein
MIDSWMITFSSLTLFSDKLKMIQRNFLRTGCRLQRGFGAGPIPEDTHVMEKISKEDRIFVAPFNFYGRH